MVLELACSHQVLGLCISQDACPPPASVASVGPSGTSIRSDVRLLLPCFVKLLTFCYITGLNAI